MKIKIWTKIVFENPEDESIYVAQGDFLDKGEYIRLEVDHAVFEIRKNRITISFEVWGR